MRMLAGLMLAALVPAIGAAPAGPGRVPVRHVIVVENTKNMDRQREQSADIASRLILQGFRQLARGGDGVELWLVEDRVRTDVFERFTWDRLGAIERSTEAFRFLRDLRPKASNAALDTVVPATGATNAATGPTLIYLVTSGVDSLLGTPYDDQVNAIFFGHRERLRKQRTPFVTVLAARDGEWVGHGVTPGDRAPYIPTLPQPKPKEPAAAAVPETDPLQQPPPAPLVVPDKPQPLSVEEIARQIREQAEERARLAPPPAVPPSPAPSPVPETEATTTPTPVPDQPAATPEPPAGAALGAALPSAPPPSPPGTGHEDPGTADPSGVPGPEVALADLAPENPATAPAQTPQAFPIPGATPTSAPTSAESAPTDRAASTWRDVAVGLILLAAALTLGLILARQAGRRRAPSLITESFNRLRDQAHSP